MTWSSPTARACGPGRWRTDDPEAMKAIRERLGGGESGLTIVEVLVAAVVLTLGAAATFGVLGAATKNAQRAKATQVALDLAQEEMERLHSLPYESLAVNSQPATSSQPLNPGYRVKGEEFALETHSAGGIRQARHRTRTRRQPGIGILQRRHRTRRDQGDALSLRRLAQRSDLSGRRVPGRRTTTSRSSSR